MNKVAESEVAREGGALFSRAVPGCLLVSEDGVRGLSEDVALEVPFSVSFDGEFCDVLSCTPCDLEDLALGFACSRGVVDSFQDVADIVLGEFDGRYEADVRLRKGRASAGPCQGRAAAPPLPFPARTVRLPAGKPYGREAVWRAAEGLDARQRMRRQTGATHAAAFLDRRGDFICMREDVGRHNAVDKLVGALLRAEIDPQDGFAFLSSRCALELVDKLTRFGVSLVATVSAPTSAVIDYAVEANVTLAAFARGRRFTVYTHPERIK